MLILLHELKWKVPVFEAKKLGRHIFVVLLVVGSCVVELSTSAKSVVAVVSCGMATSEQCFFVFKGLVRGEAIRFLRSNSSQNNFERTISFAWLSRFKKVICAMPKTHFHFFLHRMIKRRNLYITYCYANNRRPLQPSIKVKILSVFLISSPVSYIFYIHPVLNSTCIIVLDLVS